jgi:PAS domain S-box-containing protein
MDSTHGSPVEQLEVHRERDLLRALLSSTPTFFVVIDREGRTRLMNQAMLDALGYEEQEVLGTDYLQTFVPKQDRGMLAEVFDRIVEQRQRTLNQNRVITREGDLLLVEWHGTPVFDDDGDFEYFFGVGTDITEQQHRKLQVAEWESRYRALLANCSDAAILTDGAGRVIDANRRACDLLGYRMHELLRTGVATLGLPPEGGAATLRRRDGGEIEIVVRTVAFDAAARTCFLHILPAAEDAPPEAEGQSSEADSA